MIIIFIKIIIIIICFILDDSLQSKLNFQNL